MLHDLCAIALEEEKSDILVANVNDNRCRYHRARSRGRRVDLLDSGMCPAAYMNLYPLLFALHCNQDKSKLRLDIENIAKQCPLGGEGATFRVDVRRTRFDLLRYIENAVRRLINLVVPFEVHDKDIVIEVVNKNAACAMGFREGQTFSFNINGTDQMCPAAFNSVYPFLDLVNNGVVAGCPDYRTHVKFVNVGCEGNDERESEKGLKCDTYEAYLQIAEKSAGFSCPVAAGKWYSIDELIGELGIGCFSSFHVAFPYLYALHNGGQLGYLSRDRHKAGICCPSPLAVRYMVSREKDGVYRYNCTGSDAGCPRGVGAGEEFVISDFEKHVSFYASLNEVYTVVRKMSRRAEILDCKENIRLPYRFGGTRSLWLVRFAGKPGKSVAGRRSHAESPYIVR